MLKKKSRWSVEKSEINFCTVKYLQWIISAMGLGSAFCGGCQLQGFDVLKLLHEVFMLQFAKSSKIRDLHFTTFAHCQILVGDRDGGGQEHVHAAFIRSHFTAI